MSDEGVAGDAVATAPLRAGVVCFGEAGTEAAVGVSAATGMLDEPAEAVDVAVASDPPATLGQVNMMALTPLGPLK